jgi:hypothetical protein
LIDGRGAKRLAGQGSVEKDKEEYAEQDRGQDNQDCLHGNCDPAPIEERACKRLGAKSFRSEEQKPHAGQREMQRHRHDQQHQHGSVCDGMKRQPIKQRPEREYQEKRQRGIDERRPVRPSEQVDERGRQNRQNEIDGGERHYLAGLPGPDEPDRLYQSRRRSKDRDEPNGAWHLLRLNGRQRQGRKGRDIAERNKNDARY